MEISSLIFLEGACGSGGSCVSFGSFGSSFVQSFLRWFVFLIFTNLVFGQEVTDVEKWNGRVCAWVPSGFQKVGEGLGHLLGRFPGQDVQAGQDLERAVFHAACILLSLGLALVFGSCQDEGWL